MQGTALLRLTLLATALVGATGCGSGPERSAHTDGERPPSVASFDHGSPVALAADAAGVWILDEHGQLARRRATDGVVSVPLRAASGPKRLRDTSALIRAGNDLWIADEGRGLLRFDARSGRPRPGARAGARSASVSFSDGALWAAHPYAGTLRRLRIASGHLSAPVHVGEAPRDVAAAGGRVWVVDQDSGTLEAIDPRRLVPTRRVSAVGTRPSHVSAAGDRVWLSDDDGVTVYDAATLRRLGRWQAGVSSLPYMVADATGAWAVSSSEPVLVRLDRAGRPVRRVPLPSAGNCLAVGDRVIWVAGDNVLHRVSP